MVISIIDRKGDTGIKERATRNATGWGDMKMEIVIINHRDRGGVRVEPPHFFTKSKMVEDYEWDKIEEEGDVYKIQIIDVGVMWRERQKDPKPAE